MGSRRGEPARSQAVLRASIALIAARRRVPSAQVPPTGDCGGVRPAASGRHGRDRQCLFRVGTCRPPSQVRRRKAALEAELPGSSRSPLSAVDHFGDKGAPALSSGKRNEKQAPRALADDEDDRAAPARFHRPRRWLGRAGSRPSWTVTLCPADLHGLALPDLQEAAIQASTKARRKASTAAGIFSSARLEKPSIRAGRRLPSAS